MSSSTPSPYPLTFRPLLMEKVWGGDRLGRFGKDVKAGAKIGESWELADMGTTSASGAGGGAARSIIASGELQGRTLHDALALWGHNLLGAGPSQTGSGFPLLVKYLDAIEDLSVQVHPSPRYAREHAGCHLKTECWYILDAKPGSMIYKGVKPGVTRERFEQALRSGDGQGCVEMLAAFPAIPGECHNLPSGTVHALGAGVLVAEVQTPSDTTFRVYDWGRKGRELHVQQAMACIDFGPAPEATKFDPSRPRTRLVTTEFFTLDEVRPAQGSPTTLGQSGRCAVVMAVSGSSRLTSTAGAFAPIELRAGTTALVPAALAGDARVEGVAGGCSVLLAQVGQ
ncbi:type I phosphomannose isomerase catalytic subunit [Nostoc sp. CHAB 5715]|uniref:type I phosphomannose isomerase catalytic subunit n=1 Tax=Nostoc sp. CHAB 5715 TaxID=2780400 RepID=UPI001E4EAB1C|nr:type I phosphomannose isomerase catalytic subunit [Nostoc sp. CHAB 5715]MCC5621600.1 class I mannose-6-phosphate isomerase [Nostoc sp. CHAB 5715]